MNNVSIQEFPKSLVEVIRNQENISRILSISKGASECLYVITRDEEEKEIFNIVTYGNMKIKDFLNTITSKKEEDLTFSEKSNFQKLKLFVETLFEEYDLDSIEINNKKMSLKDFEEFLKSIS